MSKCTYRAWAYAVSCFAFPDKPLTEKLKLRGVHSEFHENIYILTHNTRRLSLIVNRQG